MLITLFIVAVAAVFIYMLWRSERRHSTPINPNTDFDAGFLEDTTKTTDTGKVILSADSTREVARVLSLDLSVAPYKAVVDALEEVKHAVQTHAIPPTHVESESRVFYVNMTEAEVNEALDPHRAVKSDQLVKKKRAARKPKAAQPVAETAWPFPTAKPVEGSAKKPAAAVAKKPRVKKTK